MSEPRFEHREQIVMIYTDDDGNEVTVPIVSLAREIAPSQIQERIAPRVEVRS